MALPVLSSRSRGVIPDNVVTPAGVRLPVNALSQSQRIRLVVCQYIPGIQHVPLEQWGERIIREIQDHFGVFPKSLNGIPPLSKLFWEKIGTCMQDDAVIKLWRVVFLEYVVKGLVAPEGLSEHMTLEQIRNYLNNPENLHQISELNLKGKGFRAIPDELRNFRNLEKLFLSKNKIRIVYGKSIQGLTHLKTLDLRFNSIRTVQSDLLYKCPDLETVALGYNELRSLPPGFFSQSPNLVYVDLEHNQIENLCDFNACRRLVTLRHSENRLQSVDPEKFERCQLLERTFFSQNQIKMRPIKLGNHKVTDEELDDNPCCRISRRLRDICDLYGSVAS